MDEILLLNLESDLEQEEDCCWRISLTKKKTINTKSYIEVLHKLWEAIYEKHVEMLNRGILLGVLHNNATPQTAEKIIILILNPTITLWFPYVQEVEETSFRKRIFISEEIKERHYVGLKNINYQCQLWWAWWYKYLQKNVNYVINIKLPKLKTVPKMKMRGHWIWKNSTESWRICFASKLLGMYKIIQEDKNYTNKMIRETK